MEKKISIILSIVVWLTMVFLQLRSWSQYNLLSEIQVFVTMVEWGIVSYVLYQILSYRKNE